jgi:hypothetical protein
MIHFDHIEIHVKNSHRYVLFLKKLFKEGRYKKISKNNTYMFLTHENLRFEIKENIQFESNFSIENNIGFCLPCLRMKDALNHLNSISNIKIFKIVNNPDGPCYFFYDYEGISWHIKSYDFLDLFTNI